MFQNSGYNLKSRNPSPTMHVDKLLPHEVEKKALPSHERDTSSAHNRESLFAKPDNSLHDSDSMDKGYEGVALISDNPSGGVREPLTSSSYERGGIGTDRDFRKAIVEGEFGSINGPSFLKMVKPAYPWLARRFDKEGKVTLSLFIDEHGRLIDVEIIERAGYGFDEAAIDAVKASTFRPARLNGIPVACKAVLPVRFKLE
ncbi:MAG: energy transducer TonB [Nitrospirota bacterium]